MESPFPSEHNHAIITPQVHTVREACGFSLDSIFGVISVSGSDAAAFLNSQLPLNVQSLSPGHGGLTARLDAKGRVQTVLLLCKPSSNLFWLLTPVECLEPLAQDLERFHIRESLEIALESFPVIEVHGPETGLVLKDILGTTANQDPGAWTDSGSGAVYVADPWTGSLGGHLVLTENTSPLWKDRLQSGGANPVGGPAFSVLRVEGGYPLPKKDLRPRTLLHELDRVDEMVDFTKGCYLGQETVARVHSRGRVNRVLRGVLIEGDTVPRSGSLLQREGEPVGELTSVAWSPSLQSCVALAWVRRTDAEPGTIVHVAHQGNLIAARVSSLPLYKVPGPGEQAELLYKEGLEEFKDDRFTQARDLFQKALLLKPGHTAAYEAVGVCHERLGEIAEAESVMKDLTMMDPDNPMPWTNLSRYLAQAGRIEEAEEAKAQALHLSWKQKAGEVEALTRQNMEAEQREAQLRERVGLFEQVLEMDPNDVVACFGLGKVYLDLGEWAKAEPLFGRAIAQKPDYSMAFNHRSTCLLAMNRGKDAQQVLRQGIEVARVKGDMIPKQDMERKLLELTRADS